jgi:hypothetical protein
LSVRTLQKGSIRAPAEVPVSKYHVVIHLDLPENSAWEVFGAPPDLHFYTDDPDEALLAIESGCCLPGCREVELKQ